MMNEQPKLWDDDIIHAALYMYVKNTGYTDYVRLDDALLVAGAMRDDLTQQINALKAENERRLGYVKVLQGNFDRQIEIANRYVVQIRELTAERDTLQEQLRVAIRVVNSIDATDQSPYIEQLDALKAENERLRDDLHKAATYKGIEGYSCPLCKYENGVFIEHCEPHRQLYAFMKENDRLRAGSYQPMPDGVPIESQHKTRFGDVVHEMIHVDGANLLIANGPSQHNHTALACATLPDKPKIRLCRWQEGENDE